MKDFENVYITHRGLFNNLDIPENSLGAFKRTVENSYGTELDVQMTKDEKLVVFHDTSLLRMCGVNKNLTDLTYKELQELNLLDTEYKIPLFSEVLDILNPDTPLIVEIKSDGDYIKATDKTVELLSKYDRLYTIESFNPFIVYHLKKKYPHIIRGQLSENYLLNKNSNLNFFLKFTMTYYLFNFLCKPDYIAQDIKSYKKNLSFMAVHKLFKGECVGWTVKSEESLNEIKKHFNQIIFDSFIPKN